MKRNILVFGLISGTIVSTLMAISAGVFCSTGNMEGGMIYGYASMLLAFAFVFVGVKNYRDKYNDGLITFGKAFKLGLGIMFIASTMYVITWMVESHFFFPDFGEKYAAMVIEQAKASGMGEAELQAQIKEMQSFQELYKNPVMVILFTYMEIVPPGLLAALISALVFKRKNKPSAA
ncbi:MAG: DUF4199 domain-containing protein [Bacteroidia bacterium]